MIEVAAVARWLALVAALVALALPVVARLFERLDGRGAGLALPVAFVPLWLGAYLVGHLGYGPTASVVGLAVLGVGSLAVALDRAALAEGRLAVSLATVGDGDSSDVDAATDSAPPAAAIDTAAVRQAAVVLLAAFALIVWVRSLDPAVDPIAGEKFLDFGLLKSLARADRLPPTDFWFAGEPVAYYYGGHLLAATLGDLAGTPPRLTYNLALATVYAALVAGVYEVGAAVGAERGLDRRLSGGCAAFLVGVAANLQPAAEALVRTLPPRAARSLARVVTAGTSASSGDVLAAADGFSYWTASRVIPGTINEFPLFAWLNGDLHAHMTSTSFLVLAVAVGFAYFLTPAADRRCRRLLVLGALPVVAGVATVVNTWSLPTILGVGWLSVTFAPTDPLDLLPEPAVGPLRAAVPDEGVQHELARPLLATLPVGAAALGSLVVSSPFVFGAVLGAAGDRAVRPLPAADRSGLGELLLVHGVFLAGFWAYLLARTRGRRWAVALGLLALGLGAAAARLPAALLLAPPLALGWLALRRRDVGYETALVVAGAGLVLLVEVLYVAERAGPLRMNTVFKIYAQVWVIWGIAAGVALPAVARRSLAGPSPPTRRRLKTAFVLVLLCSSGVYAAFALPSHADRGRADPTLNATAYVAEEHPEAAPAIARLDDIEGTPTILSAPATRIAPTPRVAPEPGMYDWRSSPAASLTGLPTVAGWAHEIGYRGRDAYVARVRAADRMYTAAPARRTELLRRHDVRYVWVGPAERDRYGTVSFARVEGVRPWIETESVTVYRVDRAPRSA